MSIFTAELEAIVSALRYIKSTTKVNKFVIFSVSKSALLALLFKWDHPTVQTIMRFIVFIHTVQITGNKRADSPTKAALQQVVSECLISYTNACQYISQYVLDLW